MKITTTPEASMRFQAVAVGKDWHIIDTTTGELAALDSLPIGMARIYKSRRGFPATSLAFRAQTAAAEASERAAA